MRVLVVDDDVDMLQTVQTMLDGHDVVVACNGREALRCLEEVRFDLILSDILMPVLDGLAFCGQVKRSKQFCHIPFYFLAAGYSAPAAAEELMDLGADGVIAKPATQETLLRALQSATMAKDSRPMVPPVTDVPASLASFNVTLVQRLERRVAALEQEVGALRRSEARYRGLFEQAAEAMWVLNKDGYFRYWNQAAKRLLGYDFQQLVGRAGDDIVGTTSLPLFEAALTRNRQGLSAECELQLFNAQGQSVMLAASFRPVLQNDDVDGFIISARDITASKLDEAQMYYLAYHDPLTDLPNRGLFVDRLRQALLQARRARRSVAVLFLDVDDFKRINDTYGHAAGDELLIGLSRRIRTVLRAEDTLARLGGDEFVALISEVENENSVTFVAQKVVDVIALPFRIDGQEMQVSLSAGISLYPQDASDAETLIDFADTAMYKAKAGGRNRFRYYRAKEPA